MASADAPRFSGPQQPLSPRREKPASPGPGQYEPEVSGDGSGFRSVHSKQGQSPKFSFGSAGRDKYVKTYISKQHNMILGTGDTKDVDFLPVEKTSSFASQPSSRHRTSPRASFGSASRDISPKQHFDNMRRAEGRVLHTTKDVDFLSQTTSIGSQVASVHRSAPSHGFGSAPRDAVHKLGVDKKLTASLVRTTTANVDAYVTRSAFAGQSESKRPSSPRTVFGSSQRGGLSSSVVTKGGLLMNSKNLEGLNQNVDFMGSDSLHQHSTGKQVSSARRTQPSFSFGSASRKSYEKSFVSKEHNAKMPQISTANTDFGEAEVGTGKQKSSRRRTAPSYGFGTARRETSFMSISPRRGPTALWPAK